MQKIINLLSELSTVRCYPISLSNRIGIAKASVLWSIFANKHDSKFRRSELFFIKSDLDDNCFHSLVNESYIKSEEYFYYVNTEKLLEILDIKKEIHIKDNRPVPPFQNDEFIRLCERHIFQCKTRGRTKTLSSVYLVFEGKSLEESLEALNFAVKQNNISIIFKNERIKRDSERDVNGGNVFSKGGEKNRGTEKRDFSKFKK